jgi:hypothetical protein rflaF_11030
MRKSKRIFRPKRRYRIKKRNDNAIKIISGVAALAVLVFVGYSAAGPISRYLANRSVQTETEPWTPENTDTQAASETAPAESEVADDGTGENAGAIAAESTAQPAETAITESTSSTEVTDISQSQEDAAVTLPADGTKPVNIGTPETTAVNIPADLDIKEDGNAYMLSASDMADMQSLEAALGNLSVEGYSAVIFPMKEEGGAFNYATTAPLALTDYEEDIIHSTLTAKDIASAAYSHGMRPVALVSVLNDNNRYGDYRDGSYHTLDDDAWLDASPDKGGKPWLSPFEDTTKEYMKDIVTELANAGFKEIIADDFIFPEFRSSDIELLGEQAAPYGDRYLALTSLAKYMTEAGNEAGAQVMLRITANSIIRGYSELFHPEELDGCTIMVDYSEYNICRTMTNGDTETVLEGMGIYEKTSAIYGGINARCGDIATYPMIEKNSMTPDEFTECIKALEALGYKKIYIY